MKPEPDGAALVAASPGDISPETLDDKCPVAEA